MPDPRLKEAIEQHQDGRLPEAETLYRAILADDPNHAEVHGRLGDIAYRTGHFEDAARLLHQALQRQPEDPAIWKNLVQALMQAGYADDAAKVLEEGRRLGLLTVDPGTLAASHSVAEFSLDAADLPTPREELSGQDPDKDGPQR